MNTRSRSHAKITRCSLSVATADAVHLSAFFFFSFFSLLPSCPLWVCFPTPLPSAFNQNSKKYYMGEEEEG